MIEEHLFRREAGRLVAALTRVFGVHNLALAEDVVQDALCRALDVWKFRGVPDNPSAWLMTAAKNRALDVLRRERTARTFAPELGSLLESEWTLVPTLDSLLEPGAIRDDELRLMFSCCHPRLPEDVQIALVLNVLCGFAIRLRRAGRAGVPPLERRRCSRAFRRGARAGAQRAGAPLPFGAHRGVRRSRVALGRRARSERGRAPATPLIPRIRGAGGVSRPIF